MFCNGVETCGPDGSCQPGVYPCTGNTAVCDENINACVGCTGPQDCLANEACVNNVCTCQPDCAGRECGDDGCGGTCAPGCFGFDSCDDATGQCSCTPDCVGRECGDDGCGGTCDPGCVGPDTCSPSGQCGCVPDCDTEECGDDGCGGSCGTCGNDEACNGLQQCAYVGPICNVLNDGVPVFVEDNYGAVLGTGDARYIWDNRPERYLDDYVVEAVREMTMTYTLESTDFDAYLYVYETEGSCTLLEFDDDGGTGTNAQVTVDITNSNEHRVVVTTYPGNTTGDYTILSTDAQLCGAPISQAVFDVCGARYASRVDNGVSQPCGTNPCTGVDTNFCCITEQCRMDFGVTEVTLFPDASGTCTGP